MRKIVICLACVIMLVSLVEAQTKSLTGTVIDYSQGNRGNWEAITIKVGSKKYLVYTLATHLPTPRTVGTVTGVGRVVRVYYTRIVKAQGYDDELRAARIVEIRNTTADAAIVIGNLRNTDVVQGCSCSLRKTKAYGQYAFLCDYEKKFAWMNIDGRDVKLNFVGTTQKQRRTRAERLGDRFTDTWRSGNLTVSINHVVTDAAAPGEEVTEYGVMIKVSRDGRTQTVKGFGDCGC
ncbi:MAG: hypothetical protein WBD27_08300 [Pyrinomonadaceae bacterium]